MEQKYHRYEKWECYLNGMYKNAKAKDRKNLIEQAKDLLIDEIKLYEVMKEVSIKWINSSEHNFTNNGSNARSWLGQAACCFDRKIPEDLTRLAWVKLTKEQQFKANEIADKVIKEWESNQN